MPLAVARTEREIVADTLVALLVAGILRGTQRMEATAAAWLTYDDVHLAIERRHRTGFVDPTGPPEPAAEPKRRRARHTTPPAPAPCTVDGCSKVCQDARGLAAHLRSHETVTCVCGRTIGRSGLGPHRRACTGSVA